MSTTSVFKMTSIMFILKEFQTENEGKVFQFSLILKKCAKSLLINFSI